MTDRTISEQQMTAFLTKFGRDPLLVSEQHMLDFIYGVTFRPMFDGRPLTDEMENSIALGGDDFWTSWIAHYYRPYNVQDGVLRVPVRGSLVNRSTLQIGSWRTGHEYIRRATLRGVQDKDVRAIMFDVDSPGGEAAGNFELADEIRGYREAKPMMALVDTKAYSGAYSLASAAHSIVPTPSGGTGSVGVVSTHIDASKLFEDIGLNFSLIHAGKHKVDGHPFGPLPDEVRSDIQGRVDKLYSKFVSLVAINRGMDEEAVRATEARTYDAEESTAIGFADNVATYHDATARFALRSQSMSGNAGGQGARTEVPASTEQAPSGDQAAAVTTAAADARQAERTRFSTVQGSEEYKGREALANHLLGNTDMSADAIVATLKTSPVTEPSKAGNERNHFQERMNAEPNPGITQDDPDGGEGDQAKYDEHGRPKASVSILADHRAVTGHVPASERKGGNA